MIRVAERFLTWLWNKLYNGIDIKHAEQIHELTDKGHEIIYMPCHRSHMDYLLLTYSIYHLGLVPPHIAAGVNLNFSLPEAYLDAQAHFSFVARLQAINFTLPYSKSI